MQRLEACLPKASSCFFSIFLFSFWLLQIFLLHFPRDILVLLKISVLGEGNGNPLQNSCLVKSHGWRSLVGYGLIVFTANGNLQMSWAQWQLPAPCTKPRSACFEVGLRRHKASNLARPTHPSKKQNKQKKISVPIHLYSVIIILSLGFVLSLHGYNFASQIGRVKS